MRSHRLIYALLALHAVLCLTLLTSRAMSVMREGAWAETTGLEGVHVNLVLRSSVKISPYHDLDRDATPAIYNWAFYRTYGTVASFLDPYSPDTLALLRLFTLLGAVVGAGIITVVIRRHCNTPGPCAHATVPVLVAIGTVLSPFAGWWTLTVRPDVLAYTMEFAGWALADAGLRRGRRGWLLAAAICFAVAVAFKQNAVGFLVAVILVLLLTRRIRDAAVFILVPFVTLLVGWATQGPYYLEHTVNAVRSTELSAASWLREAGTVALVVGGGVFACAAAMVPIARRAAIQGVPPIFPFATSAMLGLLQLARFGSSRNYLIGAYVAAGVLIVQAAGSQSRRPAWLVPVLAASIAFQCSIAASYLTPWAPGRATVHGSPTGQIARPAAADDLAGPVFSDDFLHSLPWVSGHIGIEVFDGTVYPYLVANGLLSDTIEARIARRAYHSMFVRSPYFRRLAMNAGYSLRELPGGVGWFR